MSTSSLSLHTSGEAATADNDSSATDDSWMNDREEGGGGLTGGEGVSVLEGTGKVGGRSSWYRSQFKELENLGKGGFGTVVKVRARRPIMVLNGSELASLRPVT